MQILAVVVKGNEDPFHATGCVHLFHNL